MMAESDRREEMPPELEAVFAAARAARPEPDAALMAAILAAAEAEIPVRPAPVGRRRGGPAAFWRGLGGWPVAGTLAASLLLGVAIGGQPQVPLPWPPEVAADIGDDLAGLLPGVDDFLTEG